MSIQINVYKVGGVWFGARWIGGEYDGCDELGCDDSASDADAIACAESMPLAAEGPRVVKRIDDDSVGN